ncbi:PD-(D/E)XK nuclease family protein [bacterium]|nr:PD-(D/E)XK nuclease family protein [bacterium]
MASNLKLSASRINTFLQCKQRYWFSYALRIEKPTNTSFKLGLACHATLEKAGQIWKEQELTKFSEQQITELLSYFDEMSVKEGVEDQDEHLLGKDLVSMRLHSFGLGSKIIGIEDRFGFENTLTIKTKDDVELIGAIDKSIEIDPKTLLIVDYKTSKTVPDGNKLRTDIQLSMYNLVARKLYPQYERVILCLDMLRKNELVYTYRTDAEMNAFEEYLKAVYDEMSALTEDKVTPSLNFLCGWCDYSNICSKYQEMCNKKEFNFLTAASLNDADLIQEWEDVKATKKILETRERELADILMEKIKVQELPVKSADVEVVLRQSSRTAYNAGKISAIIPHEDFAELVSISPTKFKKYLDKNPKIVPFLEDCSETNFTSAFLATKKIK